MGSTGTRLHVYEFHQLHLLHETFHEHGPGITTYFPRYAEACQVGLVPLLQLAKTHVETKIERSPIHGVPKLSIHVLGTGGLRQVHPEDVAMLVNEIQHWFVQHWPQRLNQLHVEILKPEWEAVYAWMTLSYLLPYTSLSSSSSSSFSSSLTTPTTSLNFAVMELGGASFQWVSPCWTCALEDVRVIEKHRPRFFSSTSNRTMDTLTPQGRDGEKEENNRPNDKNPPLDHHYPLTVPLLPITHDRAGLHVQQLTPTPSPVINSSSWMTSWKTRLRPIVSSKIYLISYFYDHLAPLFPTTLQCQLPQLMKYHGPSHPQVTYMIKLLKSVGVQDHHELYLRKKMHGIELGWCLGVAIHELQQEKRK
ncbi:Guanosine-diphosphatase [Coelomomyces lativittatus]|nr:Guanosine-diphosphatase [Coelomomyces lativittatus]